MVFDYSGSLYEAVGNVAKNFCCVFWFTGTTVLMERNYQSILTKFYRTCSTVTLTGLSADYDFCSHAGIK